MQPYPRPGVLARHAGACAVFAALPLLAHAQAASAPAGPAPVKTFKDCADCPEMIVIPPGSFTMGSTVEERTREGVAEKFFDREGPQHRVTLARAFAMARTEVTRGLYARFVAETQRPDPAHGCAPFDPATDTWPERPPYSWRNPKFEQTDEHPAACLSWLDARDFATWLARTTGKPYRLASEAEWEYAARAGTTTARYWGDAAGPLCSLANTISAGTVEKMGKPRSWQDQLVCSSARSYTQPVGSFPPNPFGLHDMIGNVYEYIADCWHPNYVGAPTDGSAWLDAGGCQQHMLRGGAYYSTTWLARSAHRGGAGAGRPEPERRRRAGGQRPALRQGPDTRSTTLVSCLKAWPAWASGSTRPARSRCRPGLRSPSSRKTASARRGAGRAG